MSAEMTGARFCRMLELCLIAKLIRPSEHKNYREAILVVVAGRHGWAADDGGNTIFPVLEVIFQDGSVCRIVDPDMERPWQWFVDVDCFTKAFRFNNLDPETAEFVSWIEHSRPKLTAKTRENGGIDWNNPRHFSQTAEIIRPLSTIVGLRCVSYSLY